MGMRRPQPWHQASTHPSLYISKETHHLFPLSWTQLCIPRQVPQALWVLARTAGGSLLWDPSEGEHGGTAISPLHGPGRILL